MILWLANTHQVTFIKEISAGSHIVGKKRKRHFGIYLMVDQVSTLGASHKTRSSPSLQKTETLAISPLSDKGIFDKRKRGLEGRDESCNEDSGLEKIRKINAASSDNNRNISTRLACPFFKRNPRLYRGSTFGSRSCRFPGFTTIHRLKSVFVLHFLVHWLIGHQGAFVQGSFFADPMP